MSNFAAPPTGNAAADTAIVMDAIENEKILAVGSYMVDTLAPACGALRGRHKYLTTVMKASDGPLLVAQTGLEVSHVTLHGNGARYSGDGIDFPDGTGQQLTRSMRCIESAGPAFSFESVTAGSQFTSIDCNVRRYQGREGSGLHGIVIADAAEEQAQPRKFFGLETDGYCSFAFGGANDLFVTSSVIGDYVYSPNSRGVHLIGCRHLGTTTPVTILGANHSIVGGDVYPLLVLGPDVSECAIGPCSYNHADPVLDNSGTSSNMVTHGNIQYAPTFADSSGTAAQGNGVVVGFFTRNGDTISVSIQFTIGSTTNLGTGFFQFGLPYPRATSNTVWTGSAFITHEATNYLGTCEIPGAASYLQLTFLANGTGFTHVNPAAFTAGDTFYITATYIQ